MEEDLPDSVKKGGAVESTPASVDAFLVG